MFEEGSEQFGAALDRAGMTVRRVGQIFEFEPGLVTKTMILEVTPSIFHGVELRRVGGKPLATPARHGADCLLGLGGLVRTQTIPDHDQRARNVATQLAQELHDAVGVETAIGMEPKPKREPPPVGRNPQRGNGRNLAMGSRPPAQERRLAAWGPGASHERCHEKAAFVDENQPRFQTGGFFLMRGQSCLSQRAISCSLRSAARRTGRWQLQPIAWRRRPV